MKLFRSECIQVRKNVVFSGRPVPLCATGEKTYQGVKHSRCRQPLGHFEVLGIRLRFWRCLPLLLCTPVYIRGALHIALSSSKIGPLSWESVVPEEPTLYSFCLAYPFTRRCWDLDYCSSAVSGLAHTQLLPACTAKPSPFLLAKLHTGRRPTRALAVTKPEVRPADELNHAPPTRQAGKRTESPRGDRGKHIREREPKCFSGDGEGHPPLTTTTLRMHPKAEPSAHGHTRDTLELSALLHLRSEVFRLRRSYTVNSAALAVTLACLRQILAYYRLLMLYKQLAPLLNPRSFVRGALLQQDARSRELKQARAWPHPHRRHG